jgi:hypothetical protein
MSKVSPEFREYKTAWFMAVEPGRCVGNGKVLEMDYIQVDMPNLPPNLLEFDMRWVFQKMLP